ncbi:hypothetical protein TcWFU_009079 [Taenia crassiceps]|uniref:Uncharacterized protein n=1 Tax=Taenia crassiceps TaxID=6207 RepID=A0ABR4QMN0_9CEST
MVASNLRGIRTSSTHLDEASQVNGSSYCSKFSDMKKEGTKLSVQPRFRELLYFYERSAPCIQPPVSAELAVTVGRDIPNSMRCLMWTPLFPSSELFKATLTPSYSRNHTNDAVNSSDNYNPICTKRSTTFVYACERFA